MRQLATALILWTLAALPLRAGEPLVVVELFTSQGCSSCPPADALLAQMADHAGVLPLALHVDYWDYLGWKDAFASPVFTQRQKLYARAAGARSIYTPQMIVGGVDHIVGTRPMAVMAAIERQAAAASRVELTLVRRGGRVEVRAAAAAPLARGATVFLVRYVRERTVDIRHGENAGKSIVYANVVEELTEVGTWDGRAAFRGSVPVRGPGAIAALVQEGMGPILAAARLD